MNTYQISDEARHDLDEIWSYFAGYSLRTTDRWLDEIARCFRLLAEFPEAGQARPDLRPALRFIPAQDFLIFYRSCAEGVQIIRVLHGSRDYGQSDFNA